MPFLEGESPFFSLIDSSSGGRLKANLFVVPPHSFTGDSNKADDDLGRENLQQSMECLLRGELVERAASHHLGDSSSSRRR